LNRFLTVHLTVYKFVSLSSKTVFMKKINLKSIIILTLVTLSMFSCQKEQDIATPINNERFKVPTINASKLYFETNNKIAINENNELILRNDAAQMTIKWDESETKKYKDETQAIPQQLDVLYTPITLNTNGHIKLFLSSIEVEGVVDSKYVAIIYTSPNDPNLLSGYVLVFNLEGNLEYKYKYIEGVKVDFDTTNGVTQRTEIGDDDDCYCWTIGEMLDWVGGDIFGLGGFIQGDETIVTAHANAPTFSDAEEGGYINYYGSDLYDPSINIPPYNSGGSGAGGDNNGNNNDDGYIKVVWQPVTIFAHGLSISNAIEVDLSSIEANWLMNTATQEQLDAIAAYLNNADQTESDGYNQSDIDFVINSLWFQINNPNSTLTSDASVDNTNALHFDSYDDFNEFLNNGIRNFNYISSDGISTNPPSTVAHFNYWTGNLIFMNIYVEQQNLGNENQGEVSNYEVTDVVSSITGVTFAVTWEQISSNYNTSEFSALQNAVIDISGDLTVHFIIDGWGQIYTERLHGRVMTDMQTGNAVDY
jgi:hypothetical protein